MKKGPLPAVIGLHGYGGSKETICTDKSNPQCIGPQLARKGFVVVAIDSHFCGYRSGNWRVLLCATRDDEVVEYVLSRTVSPALVAEYQTRLPDRAVLQSELHQFYELANSSWPLRNQRRCPQRRRPGSRSGRRRAPRRKAACSGEAS